MIGELELLNIFLIILKISNTGIVFYNNPDGSYTSEFKSALEGNLTQLCSINIDEQPNTFKDIYEMEKVVIFDFGLKINSLADVPIKENGNSRTEIGIYKLNRLKCVEKPAGGYFENSRKDLYVSLHHICLVNDTHFGVEDGPFLRTYPIEFFQQGLKNILENYQDPANMKKYHGLDIDFGYQDCKKECHTGTEVNSSSQVGLVRDCPRCHECREEVVEQESVHEVHWQLKAFTAGVLIGVAIILQIMKRNISAHFWQLELILLLNSVLFLSILELLPAATYLNPCTLKVVVKSGEMTLFSLDALSNLKIMTIPLNKLRLFKRKFKNPTIAEVAFLTVLIICSGLTFYCAPDGDLTYKQYYCSAWPYIDVLFCQIFVVFVLSSIFIYVSEAKELVWKVGIFLAVIVEVLRSKNFLFGNLEFNSDDDLWNLVNNMYPIIFLALIKIIRAQADERRTDCSVRIELGESNVVEQTS